MTAPAVVGEALARSLVEALGSNCTTAALVARAVLLAPRGVLDMVRLGTAPAGVLHSVLRDFENRGWVRATTAGWTRGPTVLPSSVPTFLDGAAAMYQALPHDGHATAVVTFPASPNGLVKTLPRTGFSYAGLMNTDDSFERIADAAINRLTILSPFLNEQGLEFVLGLFRRTRAPQKILVVRRYGGALTTARARLAEMSEIGIDVRNYTLALPKGFETFHAKVVLADQDLAYVGSANMTKFERRSMELGVMMDGKAARVIASVVRAVEIVAERVEGAPSGSASPSLLPGT